MIFCAGVSFGGGDEASKGICIWVVGALAEKEGDAEAKGPVEVKRVASLGLRAIMLVCRGVFLLLLLLRCHERLRGVGCSSLNAGAGTFIHVDDVGDARWPTLQID